MGEQTIFRANCSRRVACLLHYFQYCFINNFSKPTCSICNVSVAENKEFNIKRPYHTKYTNFSKFITGHTRKNKFSQLRTTLKHQSSVFQRQTAELENTILASYKVAQLIAKDKRQFTDGDFLKKCMMAVGETVCSEKIKLLFGFSFSARTITRRIRKISENVKYN